MKDAEDEAFDELAKRQGDWGGGYQAKRQMAANKMQEPAQEPVALVIDGVLVKSALPEKYTGHLYTTPPQRPWVGLTDEEIKEIIGSWGDTPVKGYTRKLFDQIEAKLKEKNNG